MKLKNRLIRIYLFSVVATLVLFIVASMYYLKNYDSPVDEYKMQKFTAKIAGKIGEAGGPDEIKRIIDEGKSNNGDFDFIFIDDNGSVVYSTDSSYRGHVALSDLVSKLKSDEMGVYGDPFTYKKRGLYRQESEKARWSCGKGKKNAWFPYITGEPK